MSSSTFVSSSPGIGLGSSQGALRKGSRRPKRPTADTLRASASPPADPGVPQPDDVEQARANLERLLHIQMIPTKSKRAECACIWCNGTKKRKCSWCDGRGVREEFVQKSWEELATDIEKMHASGSAQPFDQPKINVQCSACSGTKLLRCGYCRGSGIGSYGHAY